MLYCQGLRKRKRKSNQILSLGQFSKSFVIYMMKNAKIFVSIWISSFIAKTKSGIKLIPQAWVTERKYNQQDFVEMQEKFFAERQKSLDWLMEMSNANWDTVYTSQYGSTTAGEMFACWVAHDNLHVRQLVELRRVKIENMTKPYNLEYAGDW